MSYQVLARRLRPTRFDELIGQEHAVQALVHGLESGRVHHAYLFTGTRGVGKTTIARILAKCLNCETGVTSTPCGECTSCIEIAEGRHVDLLEVDAASRTKVEDTRDLLDNVQYLPTRGRYKVYLIDEVHMLSGHSFNALLKTLEEPPEHVKFLLATTDPKKVPLTVLSRCLQLQLKNLVPDRISGYLESVLNQEEIPFDDDALVEIARAARGSMRDALSITDQAIAFGDGTVRSVDIAAMLGGVERVELERLIDALLAGDGEAMLAVCADLGARAVDFADVLATLAGVLHDAAVTQVVAGRGMDETGLARRIAETISPESVQLYYQILLLGQRDLHLAPDSRCGFEMTMLRLLAFEPLPPDDGARVSDPPTVASANADSRDKPDATGAVEPGGPAAASVSTVVDQQRGPAAAARSDARAGKTSAPTAGEVDGWFELVEALSLSGVARMIAEHSVGVELGEGRWRLVLDANHDTLLNQAQVAAIGRAMTEHFGYSVDVSVEVGSPDAETPALRRERVTRERKARAIAVLEADQTVRTLVDEFDARLDLDSVKPR